MEEQTEVVELPYTERAEKPAAPPETLNQRMDRLTKELDAWCDTNNVTIVIVAVGKKSNQAVPVVDWQPDTHVFIHALASRQQ